MVRRIILLAILTVFLIPMVLGEAWFITQPEEIYSFGDILSASVGVSGPGEQLEVELFCTNRSKMLFLNYINEATTIEIMQPLTKNFLKEIKGKCNIVAVYGNSKEVSTDFIISDTILLNIDMDKQYYNPGEQVNINGFAEKANTKLLNGFFEMEFKDTNVAITGPVKEGKFGSNISLPNDFAAGSYLLNITAYEKENGEITNLGNSKISIKVKQSPRRLDIPLENQNVLPGNNLSFKVILYDQSDKEIEGEASFIIQDSNGKELIKDLTQINKDNLLYVEKNLSAGYYKIKAYSSGIYGEREFYVEENEEVEFKLINETLLIKNVGNVEYDNAIQVKIGDLVEIINDRLSLDQEKMYGLIAPDGNYNIMITDGKKSFSEDSVSLTGNAVSVRAMDKNFFSRNKSLAWFFLIAILGLFVFVSGRGVMKKKFILHDRLLSKFSRKKREKGPEKGTGIVNAEKKEFEGKITGKEKNLKVAEHSLVLKGSKYDTSLICIKIKKDLGKVARLNLDNILEKVYENKGVVYRTGNYVIPIFSPLVTKTFKNHVNAVKVAMDLAKAMEDHNRKFNDKIGFGISVHTGEIINSIEEGKLKFTSLGNTMAIAKKIADVSGKEVLLSKAMHEKTVAEVKAEKLEKEGLEIFKVNKISGSDKNKEYVDEFLKRTEEHRNSGSKKIKFY